MTSSLGPARIDGAEGHASAFDGEMIVLVLSRPLAPGTPFRGVVAIETGEIAIEGRATRSKRTADGTFEVRARLISLRRDDRERLLAASRSA